MKILRRKKGFTLVELLVTIALIAVVASLMFTFFGQGLSLYTEETKSADEQMNLRQVLSDITNKVRLADASGISCTSDVLTVDGTTYRRNGQQILRDSAVIANGISAFTASISGGMLNISIQNTAGTLLETSLSLAPQA